MAPGLRQFTERRAEGDGQPVLDTDAGEELMLVRREVSIVIGNRSPESPGTLYISTKKVVWLSDVDRTKGYAVDFLSISLHAVSRDPEAYPSPCIYTQIETGEDEDGSEGSDSECSDALDLSKVTEMRLVFCECAELNPEPIEDTESCAFDNVYLDDAEENNWIFSADQLADQTAEGEDSEWNFSQNPTSSIGHSNGDHDLARTVLELQINDHRFEDAEEMEHEHEHETEARH
uniref:Chloride conductance regulatory protein ICln n=1 Tax=Salix viminalis TaxID=40686 RepID=A0A6N2MM98_SALVM